MAETPPSEHFDEQVFQELRESFATKPDYYEYYRPRYSEPTFDHMVAEAELTAGDAVLEIGSGTGSASVPMAKRGYNLTCVEPGASLVDIARQKLVDYPNVTLVQESFEASDLPDNYFKLVYSAMALHWVAPDQQYSRPHQLLKPNGFLALLYTEPVILDDPQKDTFLLAATPILNRYGLLDDNVLAGRKISEITWPPQPPYTPEAAELFIYHHGSIQPMKMGFDSVSYAGYLSTLSRTSHLSADQQISLLHDIMELIRNDFDNKVEVPFAETLFMLQKREN